MYYTVFLIEFRTHFFGQSTINLCIAHWRLQMAVKVNWIVLFAAINQIIINILIRFLTLGGTARRRAFKNKCFIFSTCVLQVGLTAVYHSLRYNGIPLYRYTDIPFIPIYWSTGIPLKKRVGFPSILTIKKYSPEYRYIEREKNFYRSN